MSKKKAVLITIGLGILIDLLQATVFTLLTGGAYGEFLQANPVMYVPLLVIVYGGTWHYVKKNFMN